MFYERIVKLCADSGISLSSFAQQLGLSRSAATGWKSGSIPRPNVLKKAADYFGVTVDYLLGNEEIPVAAADGEYDDLTEEQIAILENLKAEFRANNIKNR